MSGAVWITKNGLRATVWDGDADQYVDKPIATFLQELRSVCHIDSGVTLGDIFRAVEADPPLKALIESYSWCDVSAFHNEANRPPSAKSELDYIEVAKRFEFDDDHAGECLDVSGMGKPDEFSVRLPRDADGNIRWGIDLTPVNELVHLPVRLNAKLAIVRNDEKIAEAPCSFTLLEILGEIYWEISFHGTPAKRDSLGLELSLRADEVKRGEVESIPLEDIVKKDRIQ